MRLSYVIVTRNRGDLLLATLERLERNTQLPRHQWEAIVVDNASDDGAPEAVHRAFRDTRIIHLPEDEGLPARNHGLKVATGRYVALVDDDSFPAGRAMPNAVGYLDRHAATAAVVGRVVLETGAAKAPALPGMLLRGASLVRRAVLEKVGGFSPEFHRHAGEYDLSFRILAAGHRIERFEDIDFRHEAVPDDASPDLAHRMDLRNNLILVERYLPRPLRSEYRRDWVRRYAAFAAHHGCRDAADRALHEARVWAERERLVGRRTLGDAAVESVFGFAAQAKAVAKWAAARNVRRVALAGFGKNFFATYRASRLAGLEIVAIVDPEPALRDGMHRCLPIVEPADVAPLGADGVVIANINPAEIDGVARSVAEHFDGPVLRLWEPRYLSGPRTISRAGGRAA